MENIPYLCGGLFFLLLVEAKATSRPQRDSLDGVKDSVSQKNMLAGLIQQFNSGFKIPTQGRAFDSDQSDYRSCKKNSGSYLPFDNDKFISAYDKKVRENFSTAWATMNDYATYYLNAGSPEIMQWLGQALLTYLDGDAMDEDERLYYCDGGITKAHLLSLDYVCIPSLILAMWHYILNNRPNNKDGRPTFEAWNTKVGEKGDKWDFTSDIGKSYPKRVEFGMEPDKVEADETDIVIEAEEVHDEPRVEDYDASFVDPVSKREVVAQFHVEAHDNAIAAGIVYGGINLGDRRRKKDE